MTHITAQRLHTQQLTHHRFKKVKELVAYMGAMQAQDYAMVKWAIGLRIPGCTQHDVEAAINKGQIIRTHLLRPTWHIVAAEDVYWMLELSKPNIGAALKSRHKALELSDKVIARTNKLLEKLLEGKKHLSREDIVAVFEKEKIRTDNNRAAHILLHAELEGIIGSGKSGDGKHTYTLLPEWIKKTKPLHPQEALAKLAQRYFISHGPATLADFQWWSGLTLTKARQALELVKEKLNSETIKGETYWLDASSKLPAKSVNNVLLLPAFDEYLISYKNRSAALPKAHTPRAISSNGIFWPTVLYNGQVTGLWKRSIHKDTVTIETEIFQDKPSAALLKKAAGHFGTFLEKKVELIMEHG